MSGIINPDWEDPEGEIREEDENIENGASGGELVLKEAKGAGLNLDEPRGGATDMKDTDRASPYNDPNLNIGREVTKLEETHWDAVTDKDVGEARIADINSSESAKSAKIKDEDLNKESCEDKKKYPIHFSTEVGSDAANLIQGAKSPNNRPQNRNTMQTCGLMSSLDSAKTGYQITPVETTRVEIEKKLLLRSLVEFHSPSTDKEEESYRPNDISTSGRTVDTDESKAPTVETTLIILPDKLAEQRCQQELSFHSEDMKPTGELIRSEIDGLDGEKSSKKTAAIKQNDELVQDTSDDELLSDGDFSTGSSSTNSLGDIEGVIAKMSPRARELVGHPLKLTQSLQSSKPTQQPSQRGVSKSETTSRSETGKKQNKDATNGPSLREMGNIYNPNELSVRDTTSDDGKQLESTFSKAGIKNQDKGEGSQGAEKSDARQSQHNTSSDILCPSSGLNGSGTSLTDDTLDIEEEVSDGEFSTGSSSSNSLGDIEGIIAKMSPRAREQVGRSLKATQSMQSASTPQKPTQSGASKSDTASSISTSKRPGNKKTITDDVLNQEEKADEQRERESDELKLSEDTVPIEEQKSHDRKVVHPSCRRRKNPRYCRKMDRPDTPVKPRKRLVNFASFEDIRLFSSSKNVLIKSSLVGKSRIRVKKGVVTPEERALREDKIRDEAKMDTDEKMDKHISERMGVLNDCLSDSNLEEEIYQEYCLDDTTEIDGTSPYPDFRSIPPGDTDALAKSTDTLLEMIDESKEQMIVREKPGDQSWDDSHASSNLTGTTDTPDTRDKRIGCEKADNDADHGEASSPVEYDLTVEPTVLRSGKLRRFIRTVRSVFRGAMVKTRRLTRSCCTRPLTD